MSKEINGNVPDARFWLSRKFWLTILGAGVFLALALTGTMSFTNNQAMIIILGLVGLNLGAHAVTDIASIASNAFRPPIKGIGYIDDDGIPVMNVDAPMPPVKSPVVGHVNKYGIPDIQAPIPPIRQGEDVKNRADEFGCTEEIIRASLANAWKEIFPDKLPPCRVDAIAIHLMMEVKELRKNSKVAPTEIPLETPWRSPRFNEREEE